MATPAPQPKKEKKSGLLFLEVGLVEISIVVIGLFLVFGTLNYFNILSISKALPFLSFLPTQKAISDNKSLKKTTPTDSASGVPTLPPEAARPPIPIKR